MDSMIGGMTSGTNGSYRMLVSDIDGTLIGPDGIVSPTNRRALEWLKERGIPVLLATGRTWGGTQPVLEQLGLDDPVILCNGAQVYDPKRKRMLWDRRLSAREVEVARSLLQGLPVHVYAVISESQVLVQCPDESEGYTPFSGDRYREVPDVFAHLAATGIRPVKLFILAHPSMVEPLVRKMREEGGLNAVQSESYAFDIVPPAVSKATALDALLRRWTVDPEEVVAVGNAPNDLDMLTYVGFGVAVGDAHPEVLAAVRQVTVPCAEDAVARVVETAFAFPGVAPGMLPNGQTCPTTA